MWPLVHGTRVAVSGCDGDGFGTDRGEPSPVVHAASVAATRVDAIRVLHTSFVSDHSRLRVCGSLAVGV